MYMIFVCKENKKSEIISYDPMVFKKYITINSSFLNLDNGDEYSVMINCIYSEYKKDGNYDMIIAKVDEYSRKICGMDIYDAKNIVEILNKNI